MLIIWQCPRCEETNTTKVTFPTAEANEEKTDGVTDYCNSCDKEVVIDYTITVKVDGVSR